MGGSPLASGLIWAAVAVAIVSLIVIALFGKYSGTAPYSDIKTVY